MRNVNFLSGPAHWAHHLPFKMNRSAITKRDRFIGVDAKPGDIITSCGRTYQVHKDGSWRRAKDAA